LLNKLKPNTCLEGPLFPEPIQIITTIPKGNKSIEIIGEGLQTKSVHRRTLSYDQLPSLVFLGEQDSFTGDARKFRLGIEAIRLGLAYEYDPYFTLSIARIDPLPHQLEAVYDYFLNLPRIRFLLADDPGAGKTIMAGLLIKELKIRGLIKRILLVTPANLTFQWQREMHEKFRESFKIVNAEDLRSMYGQNPWQQYDQAVTSISWVSRIEDANQSLLRSHWDLIIVDEAHKMSAYNEDKKTLAYQLGEHLSEMTDHFLLMTATPHKGDPDNFRLFLELLDKDVYGDIKSLEKAIENRSAPFYLRRVKEALVSFPDPETGKTISLFTKRNVRTIGFEINDEELEFYDGLTRFVEDQSIKAAADNSIRGRALGFTMAMLQRRFASSMYAVRRSLERMKEKREIILKDPEAYRKKQIEKRVPEDYYDLTDEEQQEVLAELENAVISYNPADLRSEITTLGLLIGQAKVLESKEIETKLTKLREAITTQGIFKDPSMKLLIFTEHKDTLDYLVEKLRAWGLNVTQIHGGMKVGNRNEPGTRLCAEKDFRETCQIMVATEAAGEGINLQFCWFMVNYDIPWNPVRLEQRMGRIHRYGQDKDCLIFNFVATNTREGRVLQTLFDRIRQIEDDLDPGRTGKIFNVLGDIFPANSLEKMLRDMYSQNLRPDMILDRIVEVVDTQRFKHITDSALEGLAKRELNLSVIVGKREEAKERRLVPEVIEDFFIQSGAVCGVVPKETSHGSHMYRLGKIPRSLQIVGERLEPRYGTLGKEYQKIAFSKDILKKDSTVEWVTPGHPLFECIREDLQEQVQKDLREGAVYYDLNRTVPALLDVFSASVRDGLGNSIHQRLFVVETFQGGLMNVRQPTMFLDIQPAETGTDVPDIITMPQPAQIESYLIDSSLQLFLNEVRQERLRQTATIERHIEISLKELINRQNTRLIDLFARQQSGVSDSLLPANIKTTQDRLDELNNRLDRRRKELEQERTCSIGEIRHLGRAWVFPHPERKSPGMVMMVRDDEIERIAVQTVIQQEEARGWKVQSVETEDRGFDLISRKPHPEDPNTAIEVRFIEVKGRASIGEVALSSNEYKTAGRLKNDYWLYVVFNCASTPEINVVQDPARLGWQPLVKIEHYHIGADKILGAKQ
jgi:superfamily II DNA or RNA helicase